MTPDVEWAHRLSVEVDRDTKPLMHGSLERNGSIHPMTATQDLWKKRVLIWISKDKWSFLGRQKRKKLIGSRNICEIMNIWQSLHYPVSGKPVCITEFMER